MAQRPQSVGRGRKKASSRGSQWSVVCGEGGIRTPDSLAAITVFETVAINRTRPPLRVATSSGCNRLEEMRLAVPTGFEPAFSALTGPRVWPGYTTGPSAPKFISFEMASNPAGRREKAYL